MRPLQETMLLKDFSGWAQELGVGPIQVRGWNFLKSKKYALLGTLTTSNEERVSSFNYVGTGAKADKLLHDQVGQALTRAGFQRPWIDPVGLSDLLRTVESTRDVVELIAETSCLSNGSLHFLLDVLQDRSRLYLTAVTLRELQDLFGPDEKRHVALSATRLKELPPPGVIIDELPMDDIPLLLSRAGVKRSTDKSSESDTLNLRAARQKILARVRGVRTLFVVTDTHLARRASTELPSGTVLAMDHRHAIQNRTYLPCEWWPANGQSRRATVSDASRLLWELLPHFGHVEVQTDNHVYHLYSYRPGSKMWPSDYLEPWVRVIDVTTTDDVATSLKPEPKPKPKAEPKPNAEPERKALPEQPTVESQFDAIRLFEALALPSMPDLEIAPRVSRQRLFDALVLVGNSGAISVPTTRGWPKSSRPLVALLDGLGWLAPGNTLRVEALKSALSTNNLEVVAALLRPWPLFRQVAFEGKASSENTIPFANAGAIASALGLVHDKQWAGANPTFGEIRTALMDHLEQIDSNTISAHALLTEIFLKRLHVGPARVANAWSRLEEHQVFSGFELREGGTASKSTFSTAAFSMDGWRWAPILLDEVGGIRDLVWKGEN